MFPLHRVFFDKVLIWKPFTFVCFFCFQFKKHRLSVVHTNTYAKSVVNMADLVSINSIQYCHRGMSSPDC